MKHITKLTTVFWLICIFPFVGSSTEDSTVYLSQAREQVKEKNYNEAAILFERCVYLSDSPENQSSFLIEKAKCYWHTENLDGALHALQRIKTYAISDSLLFETQYGLATTYYLKGEYLSAKSEIQQIKAFTVDSSLIKRTAFLSGLTNVQLREWEFAKVDFYNWSKYYSPNDSIREIKDAYIECLFDEKNIPKYKNPETARLWSTYLPGTGQLYAGYFWEGAASLSFQLVGLAAIGLGIYTNYYITGGVLGFGVFQRFYAGGVKRAEFLAKKRNFENIDAFNSHLKKLKGKY